MNFNGYANKNAGSTSMANTTELSFELEFGHCNGTMNLLIVDRSQQIIAEFTNHLYTKQHVHTKISLPTQLNFVLTNKNYRTDTILDKHNSIISNKFVTLKSLALANIPFSSDIIPRLCTYKPDNSQSTSFTTFWDRNGTATIDFFDKNFVEFHLHYHNTIKF